MLERGQWIRQLIQAEQAMEERGVVDISPAGGDLHLESETIDFLQDLKSAFIEAAAAFNQFKETNLGTIKIYGIAKTQADFMLFRNGYKLIFSMQAPGEIHIYYSHLGGRAPGQNETEAADHSTDIVRAQTKAFGQLAWMYENQDVHLDHMVRFYTSKFVKESTK